MKRYSKAAKGIIITTICITFLVCQGLFAAEKTLPTPEEIIAKNIEAMGGRDALNKIQNKKTVTIHKNVQANMEFKTTEYMERPNNFYQSYGGFGLGTNGKIAWLVEPNKGARLLDGFEASTVLSGAKFDQDDAHYKSMKTEGIEQINGKDCYKIVKTPENGPEKTVYYDKNTFMIVKTSVNVTTPQGTVTSEAYYEDYKKINGILFPYKVVDVSNGQKTFEMITDKIELNIEMPVNIFDIPEEVKAIMDKKETEPHAQQ